MISGGEDAAVQQVEVHTLQSEPGGALQRAHSFNDVHCEM